MLRLPRPPLISPPSFCVRGRSCFNTLLSKHSLPPLRFYIVTSSGFVYVKHHFCENGIRTVFKHPIDHTKTSVFTVNGKCHKVVFSLQFLNICLSRAPIGHISLQKHKFLSQTRFFIKGALFCISFFFFPSFYINTPFVFL